MGTNTKQVFWSVLLERNPIGTCMSSLLDVAQHAGANGYRRIVVPYARTDMARNVIIAKFMELTSDPCDTLIMLDNDHIHLQDELERLVADDKPIVGALAFRRGEPYDPVAFKMDKAGAFHSIATWQPGQLYSCDAVSPAAIAIQRKVFMRLEMEGYERPWFRYRYSNAPDDLPSEDMYFYRCCVALGIEMAVDTSIVIPHHTDGWITPESWYAYCKDHPEILPPKPVADGQGAAA